MFVIIMLLLIRFFGMDGTVRECIIGSVIWTCFKAYSETTRRLDEDSSIVDMSCYIASSKGLGFFVGWTSVTSRLMTNTSMRSKCGKQTGVGIAVLLAHHLSVSES